MQRRDFLIGGLGLTAGGCPGGDSTSGSENSGGSTTGGPASASGASSVVESSTGDAADDGLDSGTAGTGAEPGWLAIPDLVFHVGIPVELDLRSYLDDSEQVTAIAVEPGLPAGLELSGAMIIGVPEVATPGQSHVATADVDGTSLDSNTFEIAVEPASQLVGFEREIATPEQIALHLAVVGVVSADAVATVRYRRAATTPWLDAHPLLRIRPDWVTGGAPVPPLDAFAGTIFDLEPGVSYELEVALGDADAPEILRTALTTRALPMPSGAATATVSPDDDLQAALDAMVPGTILELADGTYEVDDLSIGVSGTADAPIVLRGNSRDGVVLKAPGRVLHLLQTEHLVVEDLTLSGTGVDSGTDASSQGIALWNGYVQTDVTIRRVTITGVDVGIVASGPTTRTLIYECILEGNNTWSADFIETNLTWNDDGIRIPGQGNCAFSNTLSGFGDGCAVKDGVFSAAVYFYRNRITMTGDDACEGDYATRNFAFYDNHVTNCATALSVDPVWGGPLYFFRNVVINTTRGPFKLNNTNCGFLLYNNTIVRTSGLTGWAWVQFNNGALRGWSFRNNLVMALGDANLLAIESAGNDPIDFSHNAWFPDASVWWTNSGGSFSSLGAARDGLSPTTAQFGRVEQRHAADVLVDAAPFTEAIPLGPDHLTEVTLHFVPTLDESSSARSGGTPIANITDGHAGEAPDIGAVITGRSPPTWGAS